MPFLTIKSIHVTALVRVEYADGQIVDHVWDTAEPVRTDYRRVSVEFESDPPPYRDVWDLWDEPLVDELGRAPATVTLHAPFRLLMQRIEPEEPECPAASTTVTPLGDADAAGASTSNSSASAPSSASTSTTRST